MKAEWGTIDGRVVTESQRRSSNFKYCVMDRFYWHANSPTVPYHRLHSPLDANLRLETMKHSSSFDILMSISVQRLTERRKDHSNDMKSQLLEDKT